MSNTFKFMNKPLPLNTSQLPSALRVLNHTAATHTYYTTIAPYYRNAALHKLLQQIIAVAPNRAAVTALLQPIDQHYVEQLYYQLDSATYSAWQHAYEQALEQLQK